MRWDSLARAIEIDMGNFTRDLDRNRLSREAMLIAPKHGLKATMWDEFVAHNRIIQLEGQLNQLEAVMHRMRCHEMHLEGIIARQDAELKQLRKRID